MTSEAIWKYCQENSNLILKSGFSLLKNEEKYLFGDKLNECIGNYLITDYAEKWNYIGEAKNLSKRINQQSKVNSSTFYKNYLKLKGQFSNYPQNLNISNFYVRIINTTIGRKELEEFGIVNIPSILNKFQKGKRHIYQGKTDTEVWYSSQSNFSRILEQGENALFESDFYKWFEAIIPSKAGLYWVEHNKLGLIYIGESSDIFERYTTHSGTSYYSALRRHIGENILGYKLQTIKGKKRYFSEIEDIKVTNYLKNCLIKSLSISFGRYELEEFLIRKHKPLLNRKENM